MTLQGVLILCLIWYLISFTFSVLTMQHSITHHKYKFDDQIEQFIVACIIVLLCWLVIPAEIIYYYMKEENDNLDSNFINKNK